MAPHQGPWLNKVPVGVVFSSSILGITDLGNWENDAVKLEVWDGCLSRVESDLPSVHKLVLLESFASGGQAEIGMPWPKEEEEGERRKKKEDRKEGEVWLKQKSKEERKNAQVECPI